MELTTPQAMVRRAALARPELAEAARAWLERGAPPAPRPDQAERASTRAFVSTHAAALSSSPAPITIEGADPPWLLLEVYAATAGDGTGFRPGIRLVQADPMELLDGCARADLSAVLADPRVELYVGPEASVRLAEALQHEAGLAGAGPVVTLPSLRTRSAEPPGQVYARAGAIAQADLEARLARRRERDASTTDAAALQRLLRPRLRVALIAGRFTTVLRPMTEDLAEAFRRLGHETRLISEPSDHRRLTALAYARAFDEFDPDLIVSANHTRDDVDRLLDRVQGRAVMPRSVPWVTWVQDSMPHLMRAEAGRAIGVNDLAVGHVTPPMLREFGYPPARCLIAPMAASEATFAPERADPALVRRLACEAAAMTNHSETPQAMRRRLIDEVSASAAASGLVDAIAARTLDLARASPLATPAGDSCRRIVAELAPGADAATRENLVSNVAMRLLDRARRHAMLESAARLCDEQGWRLRLYGRGWDRHPSLARFAAGVLDYHAELPSAYAAAAVTLHASELAPMHQRLLECALSGGLPSVSVTADMLGLARERLRHSLLRRDRQQAVPYEHNGQPFLMFPAYRVGAARGYARLRALASDTGQTGSYPYVPVWAGPVPESVAEVPDECDVHAMLDLTELGFKDAASLRALIVRAMTDGPWRTAQSGRVAALARASCTHTALAQRIVSYYARSAQTVAA